MTIPDPTPEQQTGIDAAVTKANAPIIAANAALKDGQEPAPLYTGESYVAARVSSMLDSWGTAAAAERGQALLTRALSLPLEQRTPLIAQVEGYLESLPGK